MKMLMRWQPVFLCATAVPARRPRRARARSCAGAPSTSSSASSYEARDLGEADSAVEERRDRDLVRRVERARVRPAALARRAREASSGKRSRSGGSNSSVKPGREVEPRHRRRPALRVRERERDRNAHVRIAEMRESCAVAEADERVDDRRRMHDDLDPLVRKPEQVVRLDELETLVRERRGVDRDLGAHGPGRMRESLLHGH